MPNGTPSDWHGYFHGLAYSQSDYWRQPFDDRWIPPPCPDIRDYEVVLERLNMAQHNFSEAIMIGSNATTTRIAEELFVREIKNARARGFDVTQNAAGAWVRNSVTGKHEWREGAPPPEHENNPDPHALAEEGEVVIAEIDGTETEDEAAMKLLDAYEARVPEDAGIDLDEVADQVETEGDTPFRETDEYQEIKDGVERAAEEKRKRPLKELAEAEKRLEDKGQSLAEILDEALLEEAAQAAARAAADAESESQPPPEPEKPTLLNPSDAMLITVDDLSHRGALSEKEIRTWMRELHQMMQ